MHIQLFPLDKSSIDKLSNSPSVLTPRVGAAAYAGVQILPIKMSQEFHAKEEPSEIQVDQSVPEGGREGDGRGECCTVIIMNRGETERPKAVGIAYRTPGYK